MGDYIFATVIGLYTGGPNSIMTPITLKMVNIDDLPAAHGLEYFFSGLGYVPGPFIAGLFVFVVYILVIYFIREYNLIIRSTRTILIFDCITS